MKEIIASMIDIADKLDKYGLADEANAIDYIISKMAQTQFINYHKDSIPMARYPSIDYLKILDDAKEEFKLGYSHMQVVDLILSQLEDKFEIKNIIGNRKHDNLRMNIEDIVTRAESLIERERDLAEKSQQ